MVDGFVEKNNLPVGQIDIQYRLIHYVLVRMIVPRSWNFGTIQQQDLVLLWGMANLFKMSWSWIVVHTMRAASQTSDAMLPYPQLITKLLKKFKVSFVGEDTQTNNYIFGEATINQMKLRKSGDGWIRINAADSDDEVAHPNQATLMETQAAHNAKVELALIDVQKRIATIEVHLRLQMTFEDIADLGREVAEDTTPEVPAPNQEPPPENVDPEPLGEETQAEINTADSTSSPANREE